MTYAVIFTNLLNGDLSSCYLLNRLTLMDVPGIKLIEVGLMLFEDPPKA